MSKLEMITVEGEVPTEAQAYRSALKYSLLGDITSNWRDNGPISCKEETLIEPDYVEAIGGEDGLHIVHDELSELLASILSDVRMIDGEVVREDTVVVVDVLADYYEHTDQALFTIEVKRQKN